MSSGFVGAAEGNTSRDFVGNRFVAGEFLRVSNQIQFDQAVAPQYQGSVIGDTRFSALTDIQGEMEAVAGRIVVWFCQPADDCQQRFTALAARLVFRFRTLADVLEQLGGIQTVGFIFPDIAGLGVFEVNDPGLVAVSRQDDAVTPGTHGVADEIHKFVRRDLRQVNHAGRQL